MIPSDLLRTWRAPLVVTGLALHALLASALTLVLSLVHPEPFSDDVMLAGAALVLVPVALVVVACSREFDPLPHRLVRTGATLALLLPLGVLEIALAGLLSWGVVDGDTHEGLDYVLGGAGLSLLAAGGVLAALCAVTGVVVGFLRETEGELPWHERWGGLPLACAMPVPTAVGAVLGVDTGDEPRFAGGTLWRGLLGIGEVVSQPWLWTGRVSGVLFVVGVVQLVRSGRRLRRAGDPLASELVRERWLTDDRGRG